MCIIFRHPCHVPFTQLWPQTSHPLLLSGQSVYVTCCWYKLQRLRDVSLSVLGVMADSMTPDLWGALMQERIKKGERGDGFWLLASGWLVLDPVSELHSAGTRSPPPLTITRCGGECSGQAANQGTGNPPHLLKILTRGCYWLLLLTPLSPC